jgi:glucose-1-phosphate cytidylyltransferase
MKVVLLAGGFGTRLSEETDIKPKPMVEIGGKPILWHIMKSYSSYGFNEFVVLLGYKGYFIKEYFANYFLHQSDVVIDMKNGQMEVLNNSSEPWKVTLLDTGIDSMTGGRIKRAQSLLGDETFMLTYGDGVSNINIQELLKFHNDHKGTITMTSVQPEGRFGALNFDKKNQIKDFKEKPKAEGGWINAGYFVCESRIFDYITEGDSSIFEQEPLSMLANDGELYGFKHEGFWMPMDTLREKTHLNNLWNSDKAPWKSWDN